MRVVSLIALDIYRDGGSLSASFADGTADTTWTLLFLIMRWGAGIACETRAAGARAPHANALRESDHGRRVA